MLIKDNWGNKHRVNNNYDNQDFIINSTGQNFLEMVPTDQLSRSGFNFNRSSVLVNEDRAVTLIVHGPSYHEDGRGINTKLKVNY